MDQPFYIPKDVEENYVQSVLVGKVIRRTLIQRGNIFLTADPKIEKVAIVDFMRRMRVWSMGMFDGTTYISAVNYYLNQKELDKNNALGALIIYIPEDYIAILFRKLGYPDIDEDDEELLRDACGTFCNIIAGLFKLGIAQLGYVDLTMSHFFHYLNEVPEGIAYDHSQKNKYQIAFEIEGKNRIMAELTMGHIPKFTD